MKKKLLMFALLACTLLPVGTLALPAPVHAETAEGEETTPYAHDIDWQYKVINGVLHKRLYNYTTGTPLSDWQVVT